MRGGGLLGVVSVFTKICIANEGGGLLGVVSVFTKICIANEGLLGLGQSVASANDAFRLLTQAM